MLSLVKKGSSASASHCVLNIGAWVRVAGLAFLYVYL